MWVGEPDYPPQESWSRWIHHKDHPVSPSSSSPSRTRVQGSWSVGWERREARWGEACRRESLPAGEDHLKLRLYALMRLHWDISAMALWNKDKVKMIIIMREDQASSPSSPHERGERGEWEFRPRLRLLSATSDVIWEQEQIKKVKVWLF